MSHPLLSPVPSLAEAVDASSGPALGLFLLSGSSLLAELCGTLPLQWVVLDMEASAMSKQDALHMLQALTGSSCAPIVRVPYLNHHLIEHALDLGAAGVMVPKVDTPQAAAAAAAACRFPPEGQRGINPVRASGYFADVAGYLSRANARTSCVVQIESALAVENADAIAATPGVDALFLGMGDLACALGQPGVMTGPAMDDARAAVLRAARAHGKQAGIFAYAPELARAYAAEGFELIAFGNEVKLLREAILSGIDTLAS
ncbi:HpcH/HpaI aldolase/citrate lyase family protein [Kitasatospora sp. NPDC052896]|uniref:HpcH/HpaI aldolase/citrate lyase family protein n=1 Tax=Kitasatospora sp. NPDC052896 TaxID=3364061 RepID=UPI0037CAE479